MFFPNAKNPGKKALNLFGFEPVCPANGKYIMTKKGNIKNTLFGEPYNPILKSKEIKRSGINKLMKTEKMDISFQFKDTGILTEFVLE